jgi:hypothetical protein
VILQFFPYKCLLGAFILLFPMLCSLICLG